MLRINISKSYNNKIVLKDLKISFGDSGLYWLTGNSGSGKTTFFNVISGRCEYEGSVYSDKEIFFLSLNDYLIENFTVRENIEIHMHLFEKFNKYRKVFSIDELFDKKVSKLSLGERQRVGLFIAFSSGCEILLLDEVFSGLDTHFKKVLAKELTKISKVKLVIISSHEEIACYDKKINLKDGKIDVRDDKESQFENITTIRKTRNPFKWATKLHTKQFYSRILFIVSLFMLFFGFNVMESQILNLKSEMDEAFENQTLYYKENSINSKNIYKDILVPLASEIDSEFYQIYNDGMYNVIISIEDKYIGDGSIFTNLYGEETLKEDEIFLVINKNNYCSNNGYSSCSLSEVKEQLEGKLLKYEYGNEYVTYKIKKIDFGEQHLVFTNNPHEFIEVIRKIHKKNVFIDKCYLKIRNERINDFYYKVNNINSLLNYNMTFLKEDKDYSYFFIEHQDSTFFSEEEIKNGYACSDIGFSCSTLNFSNFNSLKYISSYEVKDVKYKKYYDELAYNQIAISSSLAKYLNKGINDYIDLSFYFNDSFYSLDNVTIVDIIDDGDFYIYHTKYDYLLFREVFNYNLRIKYIYSDTTIDFNKRDCLDYEYIIGIKKVVDKIINIMRFIDIFFIFLSILILFFMESIKFNKHIEVFKMIRRNKGDVEDIFNNYMLFYIIVGIICLNKIIYSLLYYLLFFCFYLLKKRKIKSRITLD